MTNLTVSEKKTPVILSAKDKIAILRANRYAMMILPFIVLALTVVIFGLLTSGRFFRTSVLLGILSQTVIIGTCATGVAFIYSNGNLDISIGAVMGFSATIGVLAYNSTGSPILLVAVSIATATALMLFNCTLGIVFRIPTITVAIIVTQIYSSITTLMIGGAGSIYIDSDTGSMLQTGPFRYTAFFAYFLLCIVIYHFTSVGRTLRFIGGNENCAVQAGMSRNRETYISFLVAGIGVGLAAVFNVINVNAVTLDTGGSMGMNVMLATVLGGMSIFGGSKSNCYAGFVGALTVSALNRGLLMVGVPTAYIQSIRGVVFLILVFLNFERQRLLPGRDQF